MTIKQIIKMNGKDTEEKMNKTYIVKLIIAPRNITLNIEEENALKTVNCFLATEDFKIHSFLSELQISSLAFNSESKFLFGGSLVIGINNLISILISVLRPIA